MERLQLAYASSDDADADADAEPSRTTRSARRSWTPPDTQRYVSKRERRSRPPPPPPPTVPARSLLPPDVAALPAPPVGGSALPRRRTRSLRGHTKPLNALRWSPSGHLLASASMDATVCIWDAFSAAVEESVRRLQHHSGAVSDVQWRPDGSALLSASFDGAVALLDTAAVTPVRRFVHDSEVGCVAWHPRDQHVFFSGTHRHGVVRWDERQPQPLSRYENRFGECTLDIAFVDRTGATVLTSSSPTRRGTMDQNLKVIDVASGAVLSRQIFMEAFSCPCLRVHSSGAFFAAQTHGNYIARFSCSPPYRLDRKRRYERGHLVSGHRIQFSFSPSGDVLATGSADGKLCLYDVASSRVLRTFGGGPDACCCTDAAYHPLLPSTIAASYWDGSIRMFE